MSIQLWSLPLLLGRKEEDTQNKSDYSISISSSVCCDYGDLGVVRDVRFPFPIKETTTNNKWHSIQETKFDVDDVVLVPNDSDWSIGWLEPHGPDFLTDDSFAVLVPCYRRRCSVSHYTPLHWSLIHGEASF